MLSLGKYTFAYIEVYPQYQKNKVYSINNENKINKTI